MRGNIEKRKSLSGVEERKMLVRDSTDGWGEVGEKPDNALRNDAGSRNRLFDVRVNK